ncbi:MAG: hypothetical protein EAZ89_20160 [Bacteroidetes bacterium]|nr:MAG: hypothetical protein EAZ89_20160 [Bacteroidota bacterium]
MTRSLFFLLLIAALQGFAQQRSVVLIHTPGATGYGVAYGGPQKTPDRIVTALHLVSGKTSIQVKWEGKTSNATVEKIYQPSDLALLKLQTPLGIPQMDIQAGDPPLLTNLNYWEIPASGAVGSKTTQLQTTTVLSKLNPRNDDPAGFAKALCANGAATYPAMATPVIKFADPNVRKAHSGSPLTFNNKIVGMIDGGAKLVNAAPSLWAIPAAEFNKLFSNGTAPSAQMPTCSSENLYGGLRSDNPFLSAEELAEAKYIENAPAISYTDENGDRLTIDIEYQMSYEEIFETLFEEDYDYLENLVDENESYYDESEQIDLNDLYSSSLNVYFEAATGATIAVPSNCKLSTEKEGPHTLIQAASPYDGIVMYIYAFHGESLAEAKGAKAWFIEYMNSDGVEWIEPGYDSENEEDYLSDEYNPYSSETVETTLTDDEDVPTARLLSTLTINGTDFLGVAVHVTDWETVDNEQNERKFFYLLEACAIMTDFPYY